MRTAEICMRMFECFQQFLTIRRSILLTTIILSELLLESASCAAQLMGLSNACRLSLFGLDSQSWAGTGDFLIGLLFGLQAQQTGSQTASYVQIGE